MTDGHPTSARVVHEVARCRDRDPMDLPPPFETVAPDSLDRLVRTPGESSVTIRFEYAGTPVRVLADGGVESTVEVGSVAERPEGSVRDDTERAQD